MRRLSKGPEPQVLVLKAEKWTVEYIDAVADGKTPPKRWGHRDIRAALSEETSKRCAYCDSTMAAVTAAQVEHILPRSSRPDLVVVWMNLTLACPRCNRFKSDYYETSLPLVNPYVDDPSTHLLFFGNLVFPVPGNDRGKVTVLRLGLHRSDLAEARGRRLEVVSRLLDEWARASGPVREALEHLIREDADSGEYATSVFAYLRSVGFPT